jgi:hypothetical protein
MPGYTLLDVGLRYLVNTGGYPLTLRLNVNNLGNRRYWISSNYLGDPRTVVMSANLKFGPPRAMPTLNGPRPAWRGVLSRLAAAIVGGYAAANALALAVSALWPGPRADAVLAAILLGFAFHAAAVMWAVAARSARAAWAGLLLVAALGATLAMLLI